MHNLANLFQNNAEWSARVTEANPDFFPQLAQGQSPQYLWIGCADSRVPSSHLVGLDPGNLFVHRNVANLVVHTDLNCLSVLQYAVEVLQVRHIIVCGHYDCGGVGAALDDKQLGLINNWLRHIQDVRDKHAEQINSLTNRQAQLDLLCELNVVEQVTNVCRTTIVQDAWNRSQELSIHGWIYGLADGRLRDLDMCVSHADELVTSYEQTIAASPMAKLWEPQKGNA